MLAYKAQKAYKMNFFKYLYLMQKRILKKRSFLVCILVLPLLLLGMRLVTADGDGRNQIAVVIEDETGFMDEILDDMKRYDRVITFAQYETEEEAIGAVDNGDALMAFIIPDNIEEKLQRFVDEGAEDPVIDSYVKRETILHPIITEVMIDRFIPILAYDKYISYVRDELEITQYSDEELRAFYDQIIVEADLFELVTPDGTPDDNDNYMLSPVRGILALWLVLCIALGQLYTIEDRNNGLLLTGDYKTRKKIAFAQQMVFLLDGAAILLVSLLLTGLFTNVVRELLAICLFCISTMFFMGIVRILSRNSLSRYCNYLVLIMIIMFVMCPVFVSVHFRAVQVFLPPFYYLKSIFFKEYLYSMGLYTVISGAVYAFLRTIDKTFFDKNQ
jgi:ABC-2 type transport system permease protein